MWKAGGGSVYTVALEVLDVDGCRRQAVDLSRELLEVCGLFCSAEFYRSQVFVERRRDLVGTELFYIHDSLGTGRSVRFADVSEVVEWVVDVLKYRLEMYRIGERFVSRGSWDFTLGKWRR